MRNSFFVIGFFILALLLYPSHAFATVDPLSTPNNKYGIHILFDHELKDAARLVNTSGGDWGYVTIPIQSGDQDIEKWQNFMNEAKMLHLIPIIRLATYGDYFNKASWRKPKEDDILDFANFLNSLEWPTKNRYIIVYNEVNRDDEWGGSANPEEYAHLLDLSVTQFKKLNPDFYIISSGMDNASINGNNAINQFTYMREMNEAVPGIFSKIDGLSSHAYPNPAFSQPPSVQTPTSITSFKYEQALTEQLGGKKLPIFITETGWVNTNISDDKRAEYLSEAYRNVWNDPSIVAITPFILHAGAGGFQPFSFLTQDGKETKQYEAMKNLPKVKGQPQITLPDHDAKLVSTTQSPTMDFGTNIQPKVTKRGVSGTLTTVFHWVFKL